MIYFSVDGIKPVPQGSMKIINRSTGVMIHARAADLAVYRATVAQTAKKHIRTPFAGPIALQAGFRLVKGKSVKRDLPTVAPDVDKLLRAVMDALTGVAYLDDAQVVQVTASKQYGETPGVDIGIKELGVFDM